MRHIHFLSISHPLTACVRLRNPDLSRKLCLAKVYVFIIYISVYPAPRRMGERTRLDFRLLFSISILNNRVSFTAFSGPSQPVQPLEIRRLGHLLLIVDVGDCVCMYYFAKLTATELYVRASRCLLQFCGLRNFTRKQSTAVGWWGCAASASRPMWSWCCQAVVDILSNSSFKWKISPPELHIQPLTYQETANPALIVICYFAQTAPIQPVNAAAAAPATDAIRPVWVFARVCVYVHNIQTKLNL